MVPAETTLAIVTPELALAKVWAERHGWEINFDPDALLLSCHATHPAKNESLHLTGALDGYRALPPAWRFLDKTGQHVKAAYPAPGALPGGKSSIFHTQPVICAHFNRLAYSEGDGPHKGDWKSAINWLAITGDMVRATTLAEMLQAIEVHLRFSPGWMT